ncbi:MAG: WD40 repeat [Trebouxia sp. A1-2]|nr:MAG: WD40 repeat [Trebouxia sp. A1-2]
MNYKFSNLLGSPYRGGNLLLVESDLLSAGGNRVLQARTDLTESTGSALPFESLGQLRNLCVSPDGLLLLAIDTEGKALLINRKRQVLLHHFSFKGPVATANFSPDGQYIACAVQRLVQVWRTPGFQKSVAPMQLHRTYGQCHADVTALDWSQDSQWIAAASKDLSARVFSLNPIQDYIPPTLTGHRTVPVGVCWAGGRWRLGAKHFCNQRGAKVTAVDYHRATGMLVVGFSNGIFDLFELPKFDNIHTLSVSRSAINAITFNAAGDWVALGCAALGQLLVWEWRSESYILKQQGHYYDIATSAFSPDGLNLATGADDSKVKIWNMQSGFCFVTFSEHSAPVTAVAFLPSGSVVVSASLDGTVRAFDLVRYRNFRTMTSPHPVQFVSLAVDPAGEVICAGSLDTFQVYVWSVRTGRMLDVLAGHEGPVAGLAFSPTQFLLASASWDKTVRTWDVFSGKGGVETLQHSHDVLALAYRPDGKLLASATLDGQIYLWDPQEAQLLGSIEGRRDLAGGRLSSDRRALGNSSSGQCFTSLAFSADGAFLLAGGSTKYVCMYDVEEKVMLRRFQISHNRSIDGVLDLLNSKNMTEAGPVDLIDDDADDLDDVLPPPPEGGPGTAENLPGTGSKRKAAIRSRAVTLSPTGQMWAAATTEGLLLYSLDQGLVFDPTDLTEDITPAAAYKALANRAFLRALLIALRLKDPEVVRQVMMAIPPSQVGSVAAGVPSASVPQVLSALASYLADSPHLEFLLSWLRDICIKHGRSLQNEKAAVIMPVIRSLQRVLSKTHEDLSAACDSNQYTLQYLCAAGRDSQAS